MACQEVPKDVIALAMLDPNFKKGRGNPRKGFGRSDEKLRPGLGGPGLGAGVSTQVCVYCAKYLITAFHT